MEGGERDPRQGMGGGERDPNEQGVARVGETNGSKRRRVQASRPALYLLATGRECLSSSALYAQWFLCCYVTTAALCFSCVHRACTWGNLERNVRSPRISAVFAPQQNPTLSHCVHNQRLKNVDAIQVCCREEQHTQHVRSTVR